MSGVCGIVNCDDTPVDRRMLDRLTASLSTRGPDGTACWSEGPAGLGHSMLQTTFESRTERQPMTLDGQVWVTADARIDARDELKARLRDAGRRPSDECNDIELLLHAYHAWGEDCVLHLMGDFAFAIWDARTQSLLCGRDHFGVKPFFYASLAESLVFSNTLDCVRQHPAVGSTLDDGSIADFLLFGRLQEAEATAFSEVRRLAPAHLLVYRAGSLHIRRYWSLPSDLPVVHRPHGDYVKHLRQLLDAAVRDRLRTDRVGIEMSGGLDSTSIAAVARKLPDPPSGALEMHACNIVYDPLIPDQERFFSDLAADALGIPLAHCEGARYPLFDRAGEADMRRPEPFHNPFLAARVAMMHSMPDGQRVVLTGWDGDALMSESPKPYFRALWKGRSLGRLLAGALGYALSERRLPRNLGRWFRKRREPAAMAGFPSWINPDLEKRLHLRERWKQARRRSQGETHPVRPYAYAALASIGARSDFFEIFDPGLTLLPVEYRHPLMDLRVVTFCLTLPPWPWCIRKKILREAMKGLLPTAVRMRPKTSLQGFPHLKFLNQSEITVFETWVASPGLERYVNLGLVPRTYDSGDAEAETWQNLRLLSLNFWLQGMIESTSGAPT